MQKKIFYWNICPPVEEYKMLEELTLEFAGKLFNIIHN